MSVSSAAGNMMLVGINNSQSPISTSPTRSLNDSTLSKIALSWLSSRWRLQTPLERAWALQLTFHFALQTSPMAHTTVSRMGHFHTSVHLANRFDVARAVSTAQALTSHIGIASVVETLGFPAMLDASIARVGLVFTGWDGAFRAVFMDVALGIIFSGILTSLEHAKWSGLHGYKILFLDFES
ncbi:hypothetical protein Ae201684P_010839 [Aphanomyces euteiches]|uniref:Uncharacterized protein n=1 Tax=Aphanomyces euteiches TaxID=100861 RepID=A0A6G0WPB8_9STRA|nr:hypothetical protein Ae201684_013161 [Aphanomyces euteiches]KAH9076908.1 hypothetical protein Ae201684P_010839 [Aphanomyces euteiches]